MKETAIAKAVLIASTIVAISIVIGCAIISRAPHYEKVGASELIDTKSGTTYHLVGDRNEMPIYKVVPGPGSSGVHIEPKYRK